MKPAPTPTSQALPGRESEMTKNAAGAMAFKSSDWTMLMRFLYIGTLGGTYYEDEKALTLKNTEAVVRCIQANAQEVLKQVLDVSTKGEAPSNDPAIVVMALLAKHAPEKLKREVYDSLDKVLRTGTHLFTFMDLTRQLGMSGMGLRRAIGIWYTGKAPRDLAYQLVKYKQREGWSHRDVLRRVRSTADAGAEVGALLRLAVGNPVEWEGDGEGLAFWEAYEKAQVAQSASEIVTLIADFNLPREALPTQWLNDKMVWEALMLKMPMHAMVRNLGKMSNIGLLDGNSAQVKTVVEALTNAEKLHKSKLHPVDVLKALRVYSTGKGVKGNLTWKVNDRVEHALDQAFYLAFDNVEKVDRDVLVGVDVSGSMFSKLYSSGDFAPIEMAVATAMVFAAQNDGVEVVAFDTDLHTSVRTRGRRLNEVIDELRRWGGGGTNYNLVFAHALKRQSLEGLVTITDSESWAHSYHPAELYKQVQKRFSEARLVNIQTTASGTQLNDPTNLSTMELPGFSTATIKVANLFLTGVI